MLTEFIELWALMEACLLTVDTVSFLLAPLSDLPSAVRRECLWLAGFCESRSDSLMPLGIEYDPSSENT